MSRHTLRISYVTGTDGWGAEPTEEERASFCALVEHQLVERFPGAIASAEVDEDALDSRVTSNSDEIDCDEVESWIGNDVWNDWCSGERAPESEVQS